MFDFELRTAVRTETAEITFASGTLTRAVMAFLKTELQEGKFRTFFASMPFLVILFLL